MNIKTVRDMVDRLKRFRLGRVISVSENTVKLKLI